MSKFRYKTWSGRVVEIEAHRVRFEPGHVVFRDEDWRIVLAENNSDVHHLEQLPEDGE